MSRNRSILAALGGASVGILIGSFTARTSTRALEEELEATKKALAKAQEESRSPGAALAAGLRSMLSAPSPARAAAEPESVVAAEEVTSPAPGDGSMAAAPTPLIRFMKSAPRSAERKEAIETIAATWRARAAQAKAGFIEQAEIKDEQLPAVQEVVDHMNASVKALVDEALESGALHNPPEQREMVSLLVDLGEVYLDVDNRLRDVLTPEQEAKVQETRFELFSQVDPEVVMPLMLQLEAPPRGGTAP